ncbi:hypothetical protein AnigIFM50267_001863 [Aspergillus niger]|nr:hypothetical protein AnigIFM50267_001863 [Aspergillus niger]
MILASLAQYPCHRPDSTSLKSVIFTSSLVLSANLYGKTAIVTGSSRGIGAGIALELGRRGAAVIITYTSERSKAAAQSVVEAIVKASSGGQGVLVQANITSATDRQTLIDTAVQASPTGHIDMLVHNAADGEDSSLEDVTEELFERLMAVNLKVPYMPRGGRIILITSAAARMGVAQTSVYAASKAGMEALVRVWATELGQTHGITVNAVSPGPIATEQFQNSAPEFKEAMQPMVQATPAEARMGEVEDIVPLVRQ